MPISHNANIVLSNITLNVAQASNTSNVFISKTYNTNVIITENSTSNIQTFNISNVLYNVASLNVNSITTNNAANTVSFNLATYSGSTILITVPMVSVSIAHMASTNWQLGVGHYVVSNQPLTIDAPFAGLTTKNRYYMQYPGILYRVPVIAHGGAWPYEYKLLQSPSGMTIGQHYGDVDYGVINWSNPVTSGSPFTCQVQVTDQIGTSVNVTWSLTVTTNNFIFLDSVNGSFSANNGGTGNGSFNNPFKNIIDWYAGNVGGNTISTKSDTTFRDYFVYYKEGAYNTAPCFGETGSNFGLRMPMVSDNKPKVHLAMPNTNPVINTHGNGMIVYGDNGMGPWMGGLTSAGVDAAGDYKWIQWDSGATDVVFFECIFGPQVGTTSNNPAILMCRYNWPNITQRLGIINCNFQGADTAELAEMYVTQFVVCENNKIANNTNGGDGGGFYFKQDCRDFTVRNNYGVSNNTTSLVRYDNFSSWSANNADICWNYYVTSGKGVEFGTFGNYWGNVTIYRNTWNVSDLDIYITSANNGTGNILVTNDAIVITSANLAQNSWLTVQWTGNLTQIGVISGNVAAGITDANGNLQGTYRTTDYGFKGHEVA